MMITQKPYGIGSMVRVHHVHGGYRLPEGLPENALVRVKSFDVGYRDVEYEGKIFKVSMAGIDSGWITRPELRPSK